MLFRDLTNTQGPLLTLQLNDVAVLCVKGTAASISPVLSEQSGPLGSSALCLHRGRTFTTCESPAVDLHTVQQLQKKYLT